MSTLTEYIDYLKDRISQKPNMDELSIIRFVYIDLGRKMDFDLNYTFGNSKEKKEIYDKHVTESELNKALETHTAICKSISFLMQRILREFDVNIKTEREDFGRHMYNIVTLKDGRTMIIDLEDDLEYIQSGAKTRSFGITLDRKDKVIQEDELREIDIKKADYIKEGYYVEDLVWMLKLAISDKNLPFEERLDFVLQNLDVYRDNRNVKYRERVRYHDRMLEELFNSKEYGKIHLIDCIKKDGEEKKYQTCIVTETKVPKVYFFSDEEYRYKEISMEELAEMINNGLITRQGIPGMIQYLKKKKEEQDSQEDQGER